jgi:hypothetical protein
MWKEDCPEIKKSRDKGKFSKCGCCIGFSARLAKCLPGDTETRAAIKAERHEHLVLARGQRVCYYDVRAEGVAGNCTSIICDGMDQKKRIFAALL